MIATQQKVFETLIRSAVFTGFCSVLLISTSALGGILKGKITDDQGDAMEGVMVRVTDDVLGVSETVYTNLKGDYVLSTRLNGTLKLRARSPYFKDAKTTLEIAPTGTSNEDLVMFPMTSDF